MQQTDPQADSSTVSTVSTISTSPSRGDQTREALVAAAMDIFGRDGFHAASTRAIARAAGANQARKRQRKEFGPQRQRERGGGERGVKMGGRQRSREHCVMFNSILYILILKVR